jgi:hypothetical protein
LRIKITKYEARSFRSCSRSLTASMQAKRSEYRKYWQVSQRSTTPGMEEVEQCLEQLPSWQF